MRKRSVVHHVRAVRDDPLHHYTDTLDDQFVEEALYLTPADRESRATEFDDWENDDSVNDDEDNYSNVDLDSFDLVDESLTLDENDRKERDGAHGSHGSGRHSARNSRRFQQQVPQQQDFRQPLQPQEQRGGRQTGQIGAALGVLSNPPSPKGDYNFK